MPELNPEIVAWNVANGARQALKAKNFEEAMDCKDVPAITYQKQLRRFDPKTCTAETFRRAPSYEAEAAESLEDLRITQLYRRQKKGAQRPRLKVGDHEERQPWTQVLAAFIKRQIAAGATPEEMWDELYSLLDGLGCRPRQFRNPQTRKKKITFQVTKNGDESEDHQFGYGTFLNHISQQRLKKT